MLRIEERGSQLRIVVPGAARVFERQFWNLAGAALAWLGATILASVWAQIVAPILGLAWSAALILPAAWMFRKATRLSDIVWIFDRDKRILAHAGRVVARFEELSSARCRTLTSRSGAPLYELVVVLHRNRSFRELRLASTAQAFGSGSAEGRVIYEQAAARIADALSAHTQHN